MRVNQACKTEIQRTISSFTKDSAPTEISDVTLTAKLHPTPQKAQSMPRPLPPPGLKAAQQQAEQADQPRNVYTERAIVKGVCFRLTCCTFLSRWHDLFVCLFVWCPFLSFFV